MDASALSNDSLAAHKFCSVCQRAISSSKVLLGGGGIEKLDHHQSFGALADSASKGCHLCSLFLSTLPSEIQTGRRFLGPPASSEDNFDQNHKINPPDARLRIRIFVKLNPKFRRISLDKLNVGRTPSWLPLDDIEDTLAIESDEPQVLGILQHKAKLSPSTASDGTFELADMWIRYCKSNHHACNEAAVSVSTLPTRLLDIKNLGKNDIRLRLTTDLLSCANSKKLDYVTLSHRWGGSPTLRLLQGENGTMENLMTSIPLDAMPLTFRHAVVITRRLGYQYLWIDSLCIIQNSKSDWAAESTIMGEIYRGSVCTIAALRAKDSHGGCFTTRNPLMFIPCYINSTTQVKLRMAWDPIRLSGELLTRGWVIQERVLSPRTLFYGSSGIYWECIQSQRTEEGLDYFGETPKADFCRLAVPFRSNLEDIRNPTEPLITFYKSWVELLQSYTSTQLTEQTDKLVAFQGIILNIAKGRHYTSVAGLWKELLPAELLWRTQKPLPKKTNVYTAPSWSWACIDSSVTNSWTELVTSKEAKGRGLPCKIEWKVKIEDVQVIEKPNGQVMSASIQIKGPLRRLPDGEEQRKGGLLHQEKEWASIRGEDENLITGTYGFHDGTITRSNVFPDYLNISLAPCLFVLWVGRSTGTETRFRDGFIEPRFVDVGLVLEPEGRRNNFRRRGYFEQRFYGNARSYLFAEDQEFEITSISIC